MIMRLIPECLRLSLSRETGECQVAALGGNVPAGAYQLLYAEKRHRMGKTGYEFVREHFHRHLRDYFTMLLSLEHPGKAVLVV
jgi:hypothetical protein